MLLENQENAAYLFKAINELPEPKNSLFVVAYRGKPKSINMAPTVMNKSVSAVKIVDTTGETKKLQKTLANFYTEYRKK